MRPKLKSVDDMLLKPCKTLNFPEIGIATARRYVSCLTFSRKVTVCF
ncbi:MAG: hypothetical protein LBC27_08890 [Spirochaetaceae bacterium]|nr:hypothetical protein [Spirochaetaceae bacterium]